MEADRRALIDAFWRHHSLSAGDRAQRLEARELFWAWENVQEAMSDDAETALLILDELLDASNADPCYLGAGPIEDLLTDRSQEVAAAIAERAGSSAVWRAALACVSLDHAPALLEPYLP